MGNKVCRRCNAEKQLTEFYVHTKMSDGHLNICKMCVKLRVKKHRKENDHVQEYDRHRYQNNPERRQQTEKIVKKWRANNPDRYLAHYTVSNAIRDGRLKKMPCIICGNLKSEAHHEDYSRPLEVIWLCSLHHHRYHHAGG